MATLLKGDCLEVMKSLPDKSVDCFICDLPYGQLVRGGGEEKKKRVQWAEMDDKYGKNRISWSNGRCEWDVKINLEEFWKQVKRLCKNENSPVLMFCNTKFGIDLINSNPSWFRYDLVWDKGHGVSFLSANKMPMRSHEMVYVFCKKGAFYKRIDIVGDFPKAVGGGNGKKDGSKHYGVDRVVSPDNTGKRCPLSVIRTTGRSTSGHPTEKSVDLYEWLLSRYVPKDGTVLDPTAGSFNSILAARKLGYKAIGIEKDPGFYWKAVQRVLGQVQGRDSQDVSEVSRSQGEDERNDGDG